MSQHPGTHSYAPETHVHHEHHLMADHTNVVAEEQVHADKAREFP